MKIGALVPQPDSDRTDIRFSPTDYYGGLHCGETFEIKVNGKWIPTRIEMGRKWYLIGVPAEDLTGLIVRI